MKWRFPTGLFKKRNIEAHVPDKHWPEVKTMLAEAWQEPDADRAPKRLKTLASLLDRLAPDAEQSLREGMEDTITITRLGIDPDLAVHLHTTNPIESTFSSAARLTGRVKRWRDGAMKRRWCATALLDVEKRFRRIKGFRGMPTLLAALDRFEASLSGVRQSA
jgi:transposase-like protein